MVNLTKEKAENKRFNKKLRVLWLSFNNTFNIKRRSYVRCQRRGRTVGKHYSQESN